MTPAQIELSAKEKEILEIYRHPSNSGIGPALRQTVAYAASGGIFLYLAISRNEPRFAIGIYALFLLQLVIRLCKARAIVGVMPEILRRYEAQLGHLQQQLESTKRDGPNA